MPAETTFYYDPVLDVHHRVSIASALTTAFYAAPQRPEDARRLFEAGCAAVGFGHNGTPSVPLRASRAYGSSLVLAREWEMNDLAARLSTAIEASYEPTWDRELGEFTWGIGLGETHPRGQFNAFLAAAEASGPGMWERLSAAPIERCPQIVGVDFPKVAFTRAEWVRDSLHLRLSPLREDPRTRTEFVLVGAEPRQWDLTAPDGTTIELTGRGTVIRVPMVHADLELTPGSY